MGAFDSRRLKELMLYVSERLFDDPSFGAVKLNKVLYFSDLIAYSSLGHPITGATYDLRGRSASEVSDLSHRAVGWQIAEIGEDIPYETALLSDDPLTMEDVERGMELASEHGWLDAQP